MDEILNTTAAYFARTREILQNYPPKHVVMQVFQRGDAILCGAELVVEIIRKYADNPQALVIRSLSDGDEISPWEPVLTIEGDLKTFVHLESVYLGTLARMTRVATNTRRVVDAANGKPVIFMADRFDLPGNQPCDGYAATIGGATSVVTPAMTLSLEDARAVGTMPHALIAAFFGDVVEACRAYHNTYPDEKITALVDFNNDCVGDSLRVLKEFGIDLGAVRLDTSGNMMDRCLEYSGLSPEVCYGVNEHLVRRVRDALDRNGGSHVAIIVSGGFTPEKIRLFEDREVPVDIYGVGSSLIKNGGDFTADVVEPVAKEGRWLRDTSRLKGV